MYHKFLTKVNQFLLWFYCKTLNVSSVRRQCPLLSNESNKRRLANADCTLIRGCVADNCHGAQWKMTNQYLTSIDEQTEKGRRGGGEAAVSLAGGGLRGSPSWKTPKSRPKCDIFPLRKWYVLQKIERFERGERGKSRLQLLEFRTDIETFVFGLKQSRIVGWLHS